MLIIKEVHNYLQISLMSLAISAITFTNAQNVQNFWQNAFDFGRRFQPDHVLSSALDIGRGLVLSAQKTPIPTPVEFFDLGINLLVGYPNEQIFMAINTFCKFSSSRSD